MAEASAGRPAFVRGRNGLQGGAGHPGRDPGPRGTRGLRLRAADGSEPALRGIRLLDAAPTWLAARPRIEHRPHRCGPGTGGDDHRLLREERRRDRTDTRITAIPPN